MDDLYSDLNGFIELVLPQATRTQRTTAAYLREKAPDLIARIGAAYGCYQTLLILPTGLRFDGRSYYPYNLPFYEAAGELECSLLLAFSGEYKGAIQHLRFVLELTLLGLHFCEPADEEVVQKWLRGGRTPQMGDMLKGLRRHAKIAALGGDLEEDLTSGYYEVYDALSSYVHTRGQASTGSYMRGSNFPTLNGLAFRNWAGLLTDVVRSVTLTMVARFPWALQPLPLFEKFGFIQTPHSGFLEPFEVPRLEAVFEPETRAILRNFSNVQHAEEVRIDWDTLRQTPDLTLEQLKTAANEWWGMMKQLDQGYVPGKTWEAGWATPEGSSSSEPRTAQAFVEIVTHARRQLNVSDELILAHAYTHNLLVEGEDPSET